MTEIRVSKAAQVLEILNAGEWETSLRENPGSGFRIIIASRSMCIEIAPGDLIWRKFQEIGDTYSVSVFPTNRSQYVPWTGQRIFEAIQITIKSN